jgi:uncharacterized protein YndB with AHSA1/START domain
MPIGHTILVDAPPARLFALYVDVANRHRWDPDTRASFLDGRS